MFIKKQIKISRHDKNLQIQIGLTVYKIQEEYAFSTAHCQLYLMHCGPVRGCAEG
jgi:hypothetical protein